jgi:hypothetical protein
VGRYDDMAGGLEQGGEIDGDVVVEVEVRHPELRHVRGEPPIDRVLV